MRPACFVSSVLVLTSAALPRVAAQPDALQAHIGHILDSFKDTPKRQGLLPTAMARGSQLGVP